VGVPPPPGSTRRPVGSSGFASGLGLVEAPTEVEAQHSAAVLRAFRLDHLTKTNSAGRDRPRANTSCWIAFAMSSPLCRAACGRFENGPELLTRPAASEESVAPHGSPKCALQPRRSRRGRQCRSPWWSPAPSRSRHTPPSNDHRTVARSWGDAPSALPDLLRRTPGELTLTTAPGAGERFGEALFVRERPANCRECLPRCSPPPGAAHGPSRCCRRLTAHPGRHVSTGQFSSVRRDHPVTGS
jgi:hypothetical protein